VNLGIEALRCVALRGGRYQPNAVRRIDRRLPLREHDQGAAVLVKFRAHAGGRFATPGERQPNVRLVAHAVGFERGKD
jgi:hypothetical protein